MALLEVRDLQVRYGGIQAVRGLSFTVEEGRIVCPHRGQRRRQELDTPRVERNGARIRGKHPLPR